MYNIEGILKDIEKKEKRDKINMLIDFQLYLHEKGFICDSD
jgi:hypothetical protein